MCLTPLNKEVLITSRNMYVLKVYLKDGGMRLRSPFQNYSYHYGVLNETRLTVDAGDIYGGFHSLINAKALRQLVDNYSKSFNNGVITLCMIPKGTKIVVGSDGDIASEKIQIIKQVGSIIQDERANASNRFPWFPAGYKSQLNGGSVVAESEVYGNIKMWEIHKVK